MTSWWVGVLPKRQVGNLSNILWKKEDKGGGFFNLPLISKEGTGGEVAVNPFAKIKR